MRELLPGVWHWTATHPNTGSEVSSYWVRPAGALIDALLPPEGIEAFDEDPPDRFVLTNRHHLRHAEVFAEELGCTIHCPKPGLHEFEGGPEVRGFDFGDEVAPGVESFEIGAICPDESALLINDAGAISIADGIVNRDGELGFFPDRLLGDDPDEVKRGLCRAYTGLLDVAFDSLLFAHGEPIVGSGKDALRELASRPVRM